MMDLVLGDAVEHHHYLPADIESLIRAHFRAAVEGVSSDGAERFLVDSFDLTELFHQ